MSFLLKVRITKVILQKSRECGTGNDVERIGHNCAIAFALKDVFPDVFVTADHVYPFGIPVGAGNKRPGIALPKVALDFISVFDSLRLIPKVRMLLPEFEFDISIPDEVLSVINIDEIKELENRPAWAKA